MSSDVVEGPSTSTSSDKEKMDALAKADSLLAQGKRNLICREVPAAVQLFQDACETLSSAYGEMSSECADAYFEYGGALLELARMEQGVLGIALKDVDVDDEDASESEEKIDSEGAEGIADDKEEEIQEGEEGTKDGEEKMEDGATEGEGDKESEDADDVPNLQLAWEMIELSKVIYSRDGKKLKLADAHLKLGEISLESEQFDVAINDLKSCLEIQLQNLQPHDRAIAETYYQLGLAQCLDKDHLSDSIESYKGALKCLELKIEKLKEISADPPTEPGSEHSPKEEAEKEIAEIETILPEIREKIKDVEAEIEHINDLKKQAKEVMYKIFKPSDEPGFGTSSASQLSTEEKKPAAMDINHLIRKKRKPDETEQETDEQKKHKQEESGDATATNGHEENDATETS